MKRIPLFSLVLASLPPLMATSANAQSFDLFGTYQNQRLLDTFCANNPHLRNQKECRYYWQNQPQRTRPNTSSSQNSLIPPEYIQALRECNNSYIHGFIAASETAGDVRYTNPKLLRRARECGAISSEEFEELLPYQQDR
ncbi:hypothetical protein [Merismopedia glauca]|uniref:hypothetical protein n=1 Tax=Merismopedia glauca TaxID=292586 RepID=UPI0011B1EA90